MLAEKDDGPYASKDSVGTIGKHKQIEMAIMVLSREKI